MAVVAGTASAAGAARPGRDVTFFPGVGSITVNPLPPLPGLPADASSRRLAGRSASTSSTADATISTYRYRANDWAKATTTLLGPPGRAGPTPLPCASPPIRRYSQTGCSEGQPS